jgi:hypothetical protein
MVPSIAKGSTSNASPSAFLFQGLLAVVLLALAVPSLVASLLSLPGDWAQQDLAAEGALTRLYLARERVQAFRPTASVLSDTAYAVSEMAQRVGLATPNGKKLVKEAIVWQRRALAAAPSDGFGWARLVYLLLQEGGKASAEAPEALALERETAAFEPQLLPRRLISTLTLYDRLDAETKAGVPALMRDAWRLYPDDVDATAKAFNVTAWLLASLRASPDTEELLKKWRGL